MIEVTAATIDNASARATELATATEVNVDEVVVKSPTNEVTLSTIDKTAALIEEICDVPLKNHDDIVKVTAAIKNNAFTSENNENKIEDITDVTEEETPTLIEGTVSLSSDISTANEVTAAVQIVNPNISEHSITIEKDMTLTHLSKRTTTQTITYTLRMILFRVATMVLVLFLMYIIALISVSLTGEGKESLFPWFALLLARLLSFLAPVGYVIFDRDLRVFKLKNVWQSFCN